MLVAKPDKNQPTIGTLANELDKPVPVATDVPISCPVDSPFALSFMQAICFAVSSPLFITATSFSPATFCVSFVDKALLAPNNPAGFLVFSIEVSPGS